MVVDMSDPGGVVQVGVKELQVLAQTVSRRHASTQTIVTVLDGPAGGFAVDPDQESWKSTGRSKQPGFSSVGLSNTNHQWLLWHRKLDRMKKKMQQEKHTIS